MNLTSEITFRNMKSQPRLEEAVGKEVARLERFFDRMTSCRVMIQGPKRQERNLYNVRIEIGVPNERLVVDHHPSLHGTLEDLEAPRKSKQTDLERSHRDAVRAIHDAFGEMRRRLQDYVRRMRGMTKQHQPSMPAKVTKLFPEAGYGFVETAEGREIYFHRNSVLNGRFGHLRIGSDVHFVEEPGEHGPQASTVKLLHPKKQARVAAKTRVTQIARPVR
jgi:cold shock CspA family protein